MLREDDEDEEDEEDEAYLVGTRGPRGKETRRFGRRWFFGCSGFWCCMACKRK